MKVGDLVKLKDGFSNRVLIGIIIEWDVIYNRFGDPVEKFAVVTWQGSVQAESEYMDNLEVINESR